ncbi:class I SAM-dependent methyltransferase [Methanolobus profundi]|uniref:Methyltransferase domain-containing protein n=1 Tax=Methanolobus profundi TaxID=487685 RepID=A0A1I4RB09_9EURY|nr:class I SAM-dependent methyltransferase [Methanolobus profundi]SFM49441.1 Methyltransferase domain-containing protein [Methanolobus profundi]
MGNDVGRLCPVEMSVGLDNRFRRWLQDPVKIIGPYLRGGMEVLEVGCGPGFFTLDISRMIGDTGKVVAVDLQEGMLQKVRNKIASSDSGKNITLHRCEVDRLGLSGSFDLVFLYYVVHEIPDKASLFRELSTLLKSDGLIYIAEPPIHVSKNTFELIIRAAEDAGFVIKDRPKRFPDKVVVLGKE